MARRMIVNNHDQELAQMENAKTGISFFIKRIFGSRVAIEDAAPQVVLVKVKCDKHDNQANQFGGPPT